MRTRNIILTVCLALILIGGTAAITFCIAQNRVGNEMERYEGTDHEYLSFEKIDHPTHDIELPESLTFCDE